MYRPLALVPDRRCISLPGAGQRRRMINLSGERCLFHRRGAQRRSRSIHREYLITALGPFPCIFCFFTGIRSPARCAFQIVAKQFLLAGSGRPKRDTIVLAAATGVIIISADSTDTPMIVGHGECRCHITLWQAVPTNIRLTQESRPVKLWTSLRIRRQFSSGCER
jgi:hypothetical protein